MPVKPWQMTLVFLSMRMDIIRALHGLHDLLRGIVEIIRRSDIEIGLGDDLLALLDIGAFEPHHQRHSQADFFHCRDHAFGDDVALHDAAEDIDQNPLHVRIAGDDLERRRHALLGRRAADIEEVRRRPPIELDDVHGGHREAGAVDHAADLAVERDVIELVFRRFDFLGVFLGLVAQRQDVGMAEQRVVVEADLGIEADQLLVLGDDQRIDLEQAMSVSTKAL